MIINIFPLLKESLHGDHIIAHCNDHNINNVKILLNTLIFIRAVHLEPIAVHSVPLFLKKKQMSRRHANKIAQMQRSAKYKKQQQRDNRHDYIGDPNSQRQSYGIPSEVAATNPNNFQMVWGPGTYGYSPR